MSQTSLPQAERSIEDVQGHWLLARLGKRVLRPGGAALTTAMLADVQPAGRQVVELAPGLGRTATEILAAGPSGYIGVDADPDAARRVGDLVGGRGECRQADASNTGLPDASADVVVGEAMLTMQTDRGKNEIIAEAVRLLRPGGRYAIHELALRPDDLADEVKTDIRKALARSIKVNARPLTVAEWSHLLEAQGLEIVQVRTAPMLLLSVKRNLADEGLAGVLRIARNLLRCPAARKRVLAMRRTFTEHRDALIAISVVARKPAA